MEDFAIRSTKVASFLITRGHRVIKTSRGDQAVFFHFMKTPKLEADVEALRFGDDFASVRALYSARDFLMSLIHESGDFNR